MRGGEGEGEWQNFFDPVNFSITVKGCHLAIIIGAPRDLVTMGPFDWRNFLNRPMASCRWVSTGSFDWEGRAVCEGRLRLPNTEPTDKFIYTHTHT